VPVGAGIIEISFERGLNMERLLPAIESVTAAVRTRPGGVPVVINIPVAGATRQVRLPHQAEWDERLADVVRQAAGVPVGVELRPTSAED
jgi:DNA-binding IclR family transcriptional regulator